MGVPISKYRSFIHSNRNKVGVFLENPRCGWHSWDCERGVDLLKRENVGKVRVEGFAVPDNGKGGTGEEIKSTPSYKSLWICSADLIKVRRLES